MPFALLPLLLSVVPEAVKWIAGDSAGKAAASVTEIAGRVLGTDDPAKALQAAADPNKALEFKMAVLAAQSAAEKEETARLVAELADRQSARQQTTNLARAGSPIAWGAVVVSVIVLVGFAAMLLLIIREEVPANQRDMVTLLLGTLAGMASSVVAYWVGSSSGSAQKNAAMERVINQK